MTYINEVRKDTVFDSTNAEFIEQLFLRCPTYKEDLLSAINCIFKEKFDPNYSFSTGTWTSFDDFYQYHRNANIHIVAARDIEPCEELLISYQKPAPDLLL